MSSDTQEKKHIFQEEGDFFLIKSIRQYPDPYAFWRFEAMSLTLTDKTPDYERNRPLRFGGEKNEYTLRTDGYQKVKNKPLYKKYDERGKRWNYSKHKSLTAVKKEGFSPPAFSFNELNKQAGPDSVEVGYMLPAKPAYALPRRILQGKGGTIHRNFRYETEEEAKKAWEQGLNKTIFRTLGNLAQHGNPKEYNEVMAHVKWGPEARIAYFKNNLPSRLRAISLARDMSLRLRRQRIENGEEIDAPVPTDAKELPRVNICSYLPKQGNKSANINFYLPGQQLKDIQSGRQSENEKTRAFARFVQLQGNNFTKKQQFGYYNAQTLEIFIKLAADLTYESSVLFFRNFFIKNLSIFQTLLQNKSRLLRDIFRCVPPDKRSKLIYPLLKTPELRGYYLHSLLKFDCLEHDIEEFLNQLESGKNINFKVLGEYKPNNRKWNVVEVQDRNKNTPLHLAASRNKIKAVKLLLDNKSSINEKNKQGKTPLDLAWKGGHQDIVDYLLRKGGRFSIKTNLQMAVKKGDYKLVKNLINANQAIINSKNINGETLLHMAAKKAKFEIAKFLIEKNPSMVNERDDEGLTALHYAISSNSSQIFTLLTRKKTINLPLHYAISNDRLEMVKLLMNKGVRVNLVDNESSQKPVALAVCHNKVVATDLLLSRGGTFNSKSDEKRLSLLHAIKGKNWAVIDFLLAREGISFLSLVPDSYKKIMLLHLTCTIILGTSFGVYKNINLPVSQDLNEIIDCLSICMYVMLPGLALVLSLKFADQLIQAKINYNEAQARLDDKKTALANAASLKTLGVSEPSVAGVLRHFASLSSLKEQADKLIQIAKVDPKLSLYVIIRLFNSEEKRASEILWEISLLRESSRAEFCNLFEKHTSDELEVIVGCVTQKIKEEKMHQAIGILNMFSEPIKEKILEKLDPAYRKLKTYFTTPQDSSISDQKRRIDGDPQIEKIDHKPQQSPTGRGTFFHHDDPTLEVKGTQKTSEFVWQLKEITPYSLAERIKLEGAEIVFTYLHGTVEQGGVGLDEESAKAHLKWVFDKYENEIPAEKQGILGF